MSHRGVLAQPPNHDQNIRLDQMMCDVDKVEVQWHEREVELKGEVELQGEVELEREVELEGELQLKF